MGICGLVAAYRSGTHIPADHVKAERLRHSLAKGAPTAYAIAVVAPASARNEVRLLRSRPETVFGAPESRATTTPRATI